MSREDYLNRCHALPEEAMDAGDVSFGSVLVDVFDKESRDGDEHCVCELMARLDVSQSRMSRHMKVLREVGLVLDRRDAQWVRYRRNPDLAPEFTVVIDAVLVAEFNLERKVA